MSYQSLEKTFYRLAQLDHAVAMLGWDQQVMMPPGGNEARGRALAELQVISTEILQDPQEGIGGFSHIRTGWFSWTSRRL